MFAISNILSTLSASANHPLPVSSSGRHPFTSVPQENILRSFHFNVTLGLESGIEEVSGTIDAG